MDDAKHAPKIGPIRDSTGRLMASVADVRNPLWFGHWASRPHRVEIMASIADPRSVIEVRADDVDHAIRIAERHGYRIYGAKPVGEAS